MGDVDAIAAYQQQIDRLRAAGCSCPLFYTAEGPRPLTGCPRNDEARTQCPLVDPSCSDATALPTVTV